MRSLTLSLLVLGCGTQPAVDGSSSFHLFFSSRPHVRVGFPNAGFELTLFRNELVEPAPADRLSALVHRAQLLSVEGIPISDASLSNANEGPSYRGSDNSLLRITAAPIVIQRAMARGDVSVVDSESFDFPLSVGP
ncbi:MAG: hypothetical protein GQE15_25125 [Archangiaceae bacterium]|nr:hypothetical protein [Archangiaceae bacterium]